MKLGLKLKDGKSYIYSEEQSQQIAKNLNYIKLAQILLGNKKPTGTLKIGQQKVDFERVKSIEFIL